MTGAMCRSGGPGAAWITRLVGLCALLGALVAPVQAQTLDEVDTRVQGDAQLLRLRFNASVRLLQLTPGTVSELYTLRVELLAADEALLKQSVDEFRRVAASAGQPEISIALAADPRSNTRQLTIRLAQPMNVQARQGPNSRSIDLLVRNPLAAVPSSAPRFILKLQTVPATQRDRLQAVPAELQALQSLRNEIVVDGVPSIELTVGYFATRAEAEAALALALPRFPEARLTDLNGTPVPAAAGTVAAPPADTPEQRALDQRGADLLAAARTALGVRQGDGAITTLNELLKLPPNAHSIAAQELIGSAWELADSPARARAEYELYLKLYPQGEGVERVGARLRALGDGASGPGLTGTAAPRLWSGSIAQYYYGGKARTQSLVNIQTGIDQSTLSRTNESSIVTSVDLSGRIVGSDSETRAVVRGSGSKNLLAGGASSSSIGAVYVEHRRNADAAFGGLAVRAGRQSPISGGLLGLFDGVSLAMPIGNGLKLDVMGGVPANALVSAPSERLFAAVLEADTFLERWGGNFYLLDQTTQGITNRRSLGAEVRYAGERWSTNAVIDYDMVFSSINALSLHGSFQVGGQTTVTLLADQRRAPSLQLTNALISSGATSLQALLETRTLDQVRSDALATSATATQFLISVARPFDEHWQGSTDLRYSAVGALPAVGDFEATAATGAQISWSAQLTGTNLYSKRDIHNFNVSVMSTPFFQGYQFSYNNLSVMPGRQDLTIEPSIRLYTQKDKQEVKLTRFGPGVRLSWHASRRASVLGELLYENSKSDGPSNHETGNSVFFYVGYRYELF
jgi:hypothetical protein